MKHRLLAAGVLVLALSLLLSLQPASASVELVYFRAAAQTDNTILVTWQTATERETVGFRLYRSDSAAPADWGQPITTLPAQGNAVTGADYQYADASVSVGAKYYYLLREVSSASTADFGPVGAGVGVPTDTPTPTATATVAPAAGGATSTRTATGPAPTATRRFTETPLVATVAPTLARAATVASVRTSTLTPLPAAAVASPTGPAPQVTMPVASAATAVETVTPFETATLTPTFEVVAIAGNEQLETATPRPPKELTPVIFAAETQVGPDATPENAEQVAGQGNQSASLALIIGGSAIGFAALLVAGLLFIRSRRS